MAGHSNGVKIMIEDRTTERNKEADRRLWIILPLFLIIVASAFGIFYFILPWLSSQPLRKIETDTTVSIPEGDRVKRTFFFSHEERLAIEEREIPITPRDTLITQIKDVVTELIKGPVMDLRLTPVLPAETKVKGIFIDSSGICYINFSREVQDKFPGGAWTELLSLYSIANTITSNFPEIKAVQILVEGNEIETLAGHIDARYPLQKREDLVIQ